MDLVARIRSRPHDAPMPTEYLLDEAADTIERLTKRNDILERTVAFVHRWAWVKEGNGTSESERLGTIKHHPVIKALPSP